MSDITNNNSSEENLGNIESDQQHTSSSQDQMNEQQDNPLTNSTENDAENQDDPNQSNAARLAATDGNNATAGYRDNMRASSRANEATDSTDTGSGGLSAGGSKSASQL